MADRRITCSRKDLHGDITAICNPDQWWSPRSKGEAITDVELRLHRYYVQVGGQRVDVHVVDDPQKGKYLRTDPDKTVRNNLDDLPSC